MEDHSLAQVAQRDVHGMGQCVHRQRLPLPRHHDTFARVRQQVFRALRNPLGIHPGRLAKRGQRPGDLAAVLRDDCRRQRRGYRQHRARRHPQPMVRIDARQRHQTLHHVKAVDQVLGPGLVRRLDLAAAGEVANQALQVLFRAQEIAVQCHNSLRLLQPIGRLHWLAERERGGFAMDVEVHRLINEPLGLGEPL